MNQNFDPKIPVDPNMGQEQFSNTELSMVHLRKDEAKSFDLIQNPEGHGAPFLDEEFEIRSYAPLGERLKNDVEFRNFYLGVIREYKQGNDEESLDYFHSVGKDIVEESKFIPAPGDSDPFIKKLAKSGHGGDSIIVLMPQNMIDMLSIERGGEESINIITGLPEFGGTGSQIFKEVARPFKSNPVREAVRVATTVAGAVMGGPLGAAAGSAAGSALTGRKPQDWLGQAGKAAALTYGAQLAAPYIPGMGALAGSAAASGIPGLAQVGQTMGNWAAPAAAAGAATGAAGAASQGGMPGWGQLTSYTSPTGQNLMGTLPQMGAASSGIGSMLPSLGGGLALAPLALQGISGVLAHKADKENYRAWEKKEEDFRKREEEKEERSRERAGLNRHLKPINQKERINPYFGEPGEPYYIYEDDERRQPYKEGGRTSVPKIWGKDAREKIAHQDFVKSGALLRGPGDGRSDSIYTEVPQDTFVVNAYTVSMIGNGDSASGAERIQEWLEETEKKYSNPEIQYFKRIMQTKPRVLVAFSAGEVPILPYHVMMLGDLDIEKGHKLLESLQKNIKKHKSQHRDVLPPPTKNLSFYLKT